MAAADTAISVPLLTQKSLVNGMLCLHWDNHELFDPNDGGFHTHEFSWRFLFPENKENEWMSSENIFFNDNNDLYIKVPSLLLPYEIEYNLKISHFQQLASDNNENTFQMTDSTKKYQSTTYRTQIPSVLKETKFKKDDFVQFYVPNASFVWDGVVLEVMDNDMVKIEAAYILEDEDEDLDFKMEEIVTLHSSQIVRGAIRNENVIDITDRKGAETSLILKTDNTECHQMYNTLGRILQRLCAAEIIPDLQDVIPNYDGNRDEQFMASFMAMNILQFLFPSEYNYRFGCALGKSELRLDQIWSICIDDHYGAIQRGEHVTDLQHDRFCGVGYSCNICRMELNWYEYAYHCKCDSDMTHEFCISCIHSMLDQYEKMKPFMSQLLMDVLDKNCIETIVVFCVGKVARFDKNTSNSREKEDQLFDDSQCVGSKRNILVEHVHCPNKRIKLY